ncbi:DUF853 family protein [Halorarum salinum]|uniref:DUF853 family protein n=1 Tax=Halorarum salinum TaxID=2743089 RepID=A0A7D5QH18_9EURY|nr:DUF853 family protein [Halobaculum salinum]
MDQLQALMERVGEDEDRVDNLLTVAARNAETYGSLMDLYQRRVAQVVTKDVFYPYERVDGELTLGTDPDGQQIALTREQLNEHLLLVGMTGSGKTTFFYNLMETAMTAGLPVMVFDFKNDYRHLVDDDEDLLVINWRDFKFNPLAPPPGVQPGKWGEIFADTFAHTTDLLIGSESYFLERLGLLYQIYEQADTERAPSLFELRDLVQADWITKASPKFRYKERVASRLSMITGFSGEILDCSQGYPLEDLLERNVVFELKEPNQFATNFVIETMLTWIFYYRDAQGQRQGLRHLILFDEAKRVFDVNRERQPESGFPPIDDLVGKVREFGEGLVVADHEPSKLTDSIKANTHTKLWLTLGSGTDTHEMARTFGIEQEAVDFTRTMQKGEGLLKLADRDPVPILLPDYPVEKVMTEPEIRSRMAPKLDAFATADRERPARFEEFLDHDEKDESTDSTSSVEAAGEALLASVNDQPFLGMAERYKALGVDTKKGTKAKNELVSLDLVREVEVNTWKRGRNPKLLELTSEGRRVLRERGYEIRSSGKGGIEHQWWQEKIKAHYTEQGYDVTVEYHLGKKSIDVYAVAGDESVAIELALSPDHEVENIKKCLAQGPDRIQVVYTETAVKDSIQAALREELGSIPSTVSFSSVTEFT